MRRTQYRTCCVLSPLVAADTIAKAVRQTSELCHATGLKVAHDETYEVALVVNEAWKDDWIPADPNGFFLGSWGQIPGVPFKRLIWSNWFKTIIRVGSTGLDEYLPPFAQDPKNPNRWSAQFTARSDGEVFIYVNDTSIFAPWLFDAFYKNNKGSAEISMARVDMP